MDTAIRMVNIGIELWGGVFCIVCFVCCFIAPFLTSNQRFYSKALFIFCALTLFGDAIGGLGDGDLSTVGIIAVHAGNFVSFCSAPLLVLFYCRFEMDYVETALGKKFRWSTILTWVCSAVVVLIVISQFTGIVYYFDEANIYHRGPLLHIPNLVESSVAIITFGLMFANRKKLHTQTLVTFGFAVALPVVGGIMQIAVYGIAWGFIAFVFSALLLFLNIQGEGARHYIEREEQLDASRSKVMLSQIQPHFLFNALNSIQYLCRTDPRGASQAVATFSTFLRGNVNALDSEDLIPFDQEIEHVKAYLALEKLRFQDNLTVKWDLRETGFYLPPLTIETLAENAVKHGIRQKATRSGTVAISSYKEDGCYVVIIEDDGVGFNANIPSAEDTGTHVGLANTRTRLKLLQNAELFTESEDGVGSRVTIKIPAVNNGRPSRVRAV